MRGGRDKGCGWAGDGVSARDAKLNFEQFLTGHVGTKNTGFGKAECALRLIMRAR